MAGIDRSDLATTARHLLRHAWSFLERRDLVWLAHHRPRGWLDWMPARLSREGLVLVQDLREGRLQRSLSFIAAMSSLLGGLEVAYEHYRGSYGQKVMYTPVVLGALAFGACLWGAANRWAARTVMPAVCVALAPGRGGWLWLSHPRRRAQTGRVAYSACQRPHGAAGARSTLAVHGRLPGHRRRVHASRG